MIHCNITRSHNAILACCWYTNVQSCHYLQHEM